MKKIRNAFKVFKIVTTITKSPEVIVDKFFCLRVWLFFHAVKEHLIKTYLGTI